MKTENDQLIQTFMDKQISRRVFIKRAGIYGLSATTLASVLAACAPEEAATLAKDTLVTAWPATPERLDQETTFSPAATDAIINLNEPLVRWRMELSPNEEGGYEVPFGEATADFERLMEPRLAKAWEHSDDWTEYTFELHQGLESHAGNELTSEDVRWTWERGFGMGAIGAFFAQLTGLQGMEDVEIIDDYTFRVKLQKPTLTFLMTLNQPYRVIYDSTEAKKHVTDDDPYAAEWINKNDVGFGPYKLGTYDSGVEWSYEAFDNYFFDDKPKLSSIINRAIPESSNRTALLSRGEVDASVLLPPTEVASLRDTDGVRIWNYPSLNMIQLLLDNSEEPFNDVRVRQAMSYATPSQSILDQVLLGFARPIGSMMPDLFPGYVDVSPYTFDLNKARGLLAEAGLEDGFETTYAYDSESSIAELVGIQLRTTWEEIGVKLNLKAMPTAAYFEAVFGRTEPIKFYEAAPLTPDPYFSVFLNFFSESGLNFGNFSDPEVDEAINQGEVLDWEKRLKMFEGVQKRLMEEAPWVFIGMKGLQIAGRDNVTGLNDWTTSTRWNFVDFA